MKSAAKKDGIRALILSIILLIIAVTMVLLPLGSKKDDLEKTSVRQTTTDGEIALKDVRAQIRGDNIMKGRDDITLLFDELSKDLSIVSINKERGSKSDSPLIDLVCKGKREGIDKIDDLLKRRNLSNKLKQINLERINDGGEYQYTVKLQL